MRIKKFLFSLRQILWEKTIISFGLDYNEESFHLDLLSKHMKEIGSVVTRTTLALVFLCLTLGILRKKSSDLQMKVGMN